MPTPPEQKKKRSYKNLVEDGGIEMFEIRMSYWFDADGHRHVTAIGCTEGESVYWPDYWDLITVLEVGKQALVEHYADDEKGS